MKVDSDSALKFFELVKEPILICLMAVIILLFILLFKKDKDLMKVHESCSMNDRESTETLAKLVALVEMMVYGRRLDR